MTLKELRERLRIRCAYTLTEKQSNLLADVFCKGDLEADCFDGVIVSTPKKIVEACTGKFNYILHEDGNQSKEPQSEDIFFGVMYDPFMGKKCIIVVPE